LTAKFEAAQKTNSAPKEEVKTQNVKQTRKVSAKQLKKVEKETVG